MQRARQLPEQGKQEKPPKTLLLSFQPGEMKFLHSLMGSLDPMVSKTFLSGPATHAADADIGASAVECSLIDCASIVTPANHGWYDDIVASFFLCLLSMCL